MQRLMLLPALLLALATPSLGQDSAGLEYLIEGNDGTHGDFTGRLTLRSAGPDRYQAERRVQFARRDLTLLGGRGRREDWELRVLFDTHTGATGRVAGEDSPPAFKLRVEFDGEQDEVIATESRWLSKSEGLGFRVFDVPREGRPETTGPSFKYMAVKGVAFLKGEGDPHEVDINDVKQGGIGDCYFMAGLAAVARTHPHRIRSMIHTNPDGTFTVYLWKHDYQWGEEVVDADGYFIPRVKATRVTVDAEFPTTFGNGPCYAKWGDTATIDGVETHELWPMILEKAYAKHLKSFKKIEGGVASTAMSFFSGEDSVVDHEPAKLSEEKLLAILKRAHEKGYPVTFGVPTRVPDLAMVGNHYYSFGGVDEQGRIKLLNPWGSYHPNRPLTPKELKAHVDMIHVGEF